MHHADATLKLTLDCAGISIQGHHPADDLLLGKKESLCALKFLRVAQPDPKTIKPEGTRLVEFSVTLKRTSFVEEEQEEEKENKVNMVFSPIVK